MPSSLQKSILAAVAGAAVVSAHGHVTKVFINGQEFPGFNPFSGQAQPDSVGWGTAAKDNGFILANDLGSPNIACHLGSTPAQKSATVAAGSKVTVVWDTWPESHHGPVIDYLAACGAGGCETAKAEDLLFFKIDEAGLEGGQWASDKLMAAGMKWDITIPASIAPGAYVLRHEMIGLHEANRGGAQFYPQCVNLVVTGSGSDAPAGVKATALYTAKDPGVLFNLYNNPTSYPIPGPAVFSGGSGGGSTGGNTGGTTPSATKSAGSPGATSTSTPSTGGGCGSRKVRRAARKARREALMAAADALVESLD